MGCCAWCNFMDLCAGWGSREQGVRSVVPVVNRSGACDDSMDPRQCRLVSLPSVLFGWFRKDLQELRFLRLVAQAADADEYIRRAVEMPQFIVEVSWLDLFKLIVWWATMAMSYYAGRSRGYQEVPAGQKKSKVDFAPQVAEVSEKLPHVFMTKKEGKVLHLDSSCRHLVARETQAMNWCSTCGSAKTSKVA